jgi:hypothetical protein
VKYCFPVLHASHLFDQIYQHEEEVVVKEVTKEDDDARVGCALNSFFFCELRYMLEFLVRTQVASPIHFLKAPFFKRNSSSELCLFWICWQ